MIDLQRSSYSALIASIQAFYVSELYDQISILCILKGPDQFVSGLLFKAKEEFYTLLQVVIRKERKALAFDHI
jgi:hypothetical protein